MTHNFLESLLAFSSNHEVHTIPEIDSKLNNAEAQTDKRMSKIFSKIDGHIFCMDEREPANKDLFSNILDTLKDLKATVRSLRTTIIATTICVGASVESEKQMATTLSAAKKRIEQTQDLIEVKQKRYAASQSSIK